MNNPSLALKSVRNIEIQGIFQVSASNVFLQQEMHIRTYQKHLKKKVSHQQIKFHLKINWIFLTPEDLFQKNSQKSVWSVDQKPSSKCQTTVVMANFYLYTFFLALSFSINSYLPKLIFTHSLTKCAALQAGTKKMTQLCPVSPPHPLR